MLGEAQKKYRQLSFYRENPVIQFDSAYREESMYWKVFAVFITNAYPEQDNGYVFPYTQTDFATQDQFMQWIEQVQARSLYHTPVDIQPGDQILTLSTCSYEITEGRLVIMARLVRDGESTEVDVSAAQSNSSGVYPQAWCDKYNVTKVSEVSKAPAVSSTPVVSSDPPSSEASVSPSSTSSRPPVSSTAPVSSNSPPVTSIEPPPDSSAAEPSAPSEPVDPSSSEQPSEPSEAPSELPSEPSSELEPPPVSSAPEESSQPEPSSEAPPVESVASE